MPNFTHPTPSAMTLPKKSDPLDAAAQRQQALSRWDNEGGAGAARQVVVAACVGMPVLQTATLVQTELEHLRSRVIALENVVIALLSEGSDEQRWQVSDMAAYIVPRTGRTRHALTLDAADHMSQLLERAQRFRPDLPA